MCVCVCVCVSFYVYGPSLWQAMMSVKANHHFSQSPELELIQPWILVRAKSFISIPLCRYAMIPLPSIQGMPIEV